MSDERQSSSVALFTEHRHDCVHPPGSLKRKLGQAIPISRHERVTYPSPPMSTPPSPRRPSPRPVSDHPAEQQPLPPSTSLPATSNQQIPEQIITDQPRPAPTLLFERSAEHTAFIPATFGEPPPGAPIGAFAGGQNVFSVGQASSTGPTLTSPTQPKSGRKAKAHVASACMNCKRAHLSCDAQRPCTRCVTSGKQVSFGTGRTCITLY